MSGVFGKHTHTHLSSHSQALERAIQERERERESCSCRSEMLYMRPSQGFEDKDGKTLVGNR